MANKIAARTYYDSESKTVHLVTRSGDSIALSPHFLPAGHVLIPEEFYHTLVAYRDWRRPVNEVP